MARRPVKRDAGSSSALQPVHQHLCIGIGNVLLQEVAAALENGVVGARIMIMGTPDADDPGLNRILAAGAKHGLPVNVLCWGRLPLLGELARRNPNTQIVLDHLGLTQSFEPPAPPEPFADLANVVALAEYDNVAIKISGACTLSHQPFPYSDLWGPLGQIFEAFGFERCLWGPDWT